MRTRRLESTTEQAERMHVLTTAPSPPHRCGRDVSNRRQVQERRRAAAPGRVSSTAQGVPEGVRLIASEDPLIASEDPLIAAVHHVMTPLMASLIRYELCDQTADPRGQIYSALSQLKEVP